MGVPDLHGLVPAGAGQLPAVGAKRHARHRLGVAFQTDQLLRRRRVPNHNGPIVIPTGGGDETAVAAASDLKMSFTGHVLVTLSRDSKALLAGKRIPNPHGLVPASGGETLSVWRESNAGNA